MRPLFRFLVATENGDAPADEEWFARPVPVSRQGTAAAGLDFRAYFGLIEEALSGEGAVILSSALGGRLPEAVAVTAEKHGALYHPARITAEGGGARALLCANVALTDAARFLALREASILARLYGEFPGKSVPRALGFTTAESGGFTAGVLFTEWLAGFNEFHLTRLPESNGIRCRVWDTASGPYILPDADLGRVLEAAARILSRHYDPVSTAQIYPWHHAAGDFAVRREPSGEFSVRLVTARGYGSIFGGPESGLPGPLTAGLYFFADTTLRMRLDRDNGTGELLLAPEALVPSILSGFFAGLSDRGKMTGQHAGFSDGLRRHLKDAGPEALAEAAAELLAACDPRSPDPAFLAPHVRSHAQAIWRQL